MKKTMVKRICKCICNCAVVDKYTFGIWTSCMNSLLPSLISQGEQGFPGLIGSQGEDGFSGDEGQPGPPGFMVCHMKL